MGIRFRLTFHHSSSGFFRFDEQSVPLDLGDELTLNLTARDADTLAKAKRFHIEGRGFPSEEAARSVGERLRLRLRFSTACLALESRFRSSIREGQRWRMPSRRKCSEKLVGLSSIR